MGLEIMTLLAIITFLQLTTSLIPESSQGVPKIGILKLNVFYFSFYNFFLNFQGIYFASVLMIASISVIMNVIILKFHYSNVQIDEIHPWVNHISFITFKN